MDDSPAPVAATSGLPVPVHVKVLIVHDGCSILGEGHELRLQRVHPSTPGASGLDGEQPPGAQDMDLQQLSHTKAPHGVVRKWLDEGIDDDLGDLMGAFCGSNVGGAGY